MSVQEKLQESRARLNKAGNDSDYLGLAFSSIHEVLGEVCRSLLSEPSIKQQHGIDVQDKAKANWQDLLELMPIYYGWSERDIRYIRKMNSWRNQFAHEFSFEGTRQDVEQYLNYVENIISNTSFATIENSNDNLFDSCIEVEDSQQYCYFPNNISHGGAVTPFRFQIKRNEGIVEIFNRKKTSVITIDAIEKYNLYNLEQLESYLTSIKIKINYYFNKGYFKATILFGLCLIVTATNSIIPALTMVLAIALFRVLLNFLIASLKSLINNIFRKVFFTTTLKLLANRIWIGDKIYPQNNYFQCLPESDRGSRLYKIYLLSREKVCIAHNLTWHESDELIRIATNAKYMIEDARSVFSIEHKDGLIFFEYHQSKKSFALQYNDKLWESLRCRIIENNIVELTQSEQEELYSRKLQEFSV